MGQFMSCNSLLLSVPKEEYNIFKSKLGNTSSIQRGSLRSECSEYESSESDCWLYDFSFTQFCLPGLLCVSRDPGLNERELSIIGKSGLREKYEGRGFGLRVNSHCSECWEFESSKYDGWLYDFFRKRFCLPCLPCLPFLNGRVVLNEKMLNENMPNEKMPNVTMLCETIGMPGMGAKDERRGFDLTIDPDKNGVLETILTIGLVVA